jgi:hypothetical protein
MTLIYEYTPNVPDASPSGTVFDTTRTGTTQRAAPSTRAGMWDALQTALLAAGWSENSLATRDSVFYSTGESAAEQIGMRIILDSTRIQFLLGAKLDASNALEGEIGVTTGAGVGTLDNWNIATEEAMDFQIRADLDSIWAFFQNTAHTGSVFSMFMGRMIRDGVGVVPDVFTPTAGITAGRFVTVTVTGNPLTAGLTPGDVLQLAEFDASTSPAAERAVVAAVTTTSITFVRLANSYVDARIGMLAQPLFRWVGTNNDLDLVSNWTSPFHWDNVRDQDLQNTGAGSSGNDHAYRTVWALSGGVAAPGAASGGEFGSGGSPAEANLRFLARAAVMGSATTDHPGQMGRVPGLWQYAGTPTLFPHDWFDDQRASPVVQASPQRFTSTSPDYYALGPMPL